LQANSLERGGGIEVRDVTFANPAGGRTAAYPVKSAKGRGPGILFVPWYEPRAKDSNRTQFLDQAIELAGGGETSLLIETMWSAPQWFSTRYRSKDSDASVRQVREPRRALDGLMAQDGPDADRSRWPRFRRHPERQAVIDRLAPLDPVLYTGRTEPPPYCFSSDGRIHMCRRRGPASSSRPRGSRSPSSSTTAGTGWMGRPSATGRPG
jgi:hypothetical protein